MEPALGRGARSGRQRPPPRALAAYEFAFDSPYVKAHADLREFALPSFPKGRPLLEAMVDLTKRIHTQFKHDPTATQISTPLAEVLRLRRGVCQDFSHLEIGCLRSLGLPGRYVSGYLLTLPPPGKPRLVGADASHAWISTYFPDIGWVDFDPSNNAMPAEIMSRLALGATLATSLRCAASSSEGAPIITCALRSTWCASKTAEPPGEPQRPAPAYRGM